MKLRYYLRGVGIGMFVTALILSVSFSQKKTMSDEQVKARASELGMVESTSLLQSVVNEEPKEEVKEQPTATPTQTETPTPTPEPTKEPEAPETETVEEQPATTDSQAQPETEINTEVTTEDPESIGKTQPLANPGSSTKVSIRINSGDSSVTVSNTVAAAGLVASAADFDQFLCAGGYDKRLRVGDYEIPYDLTYSEIAKILVGEQ